MNDGEQSQDQQDQRDQNEVGEESQDQQKNNQKNNVDKTISPEQILEREEAEAILNSLKANEKNMMKRRYMSVKTKKVLKDW